MNLRNVPQSEFDAIDGARQIIVHEWSRRFAILESDDIGQYGLCWRSDMIEPVVKIAPDSGTVWVGIDERIAVIELKRGRVVLSLGVFGNVLDIHFCECFIVVLMDDTTAVFNADFSVHKFVHMPELPVTVECHDGQWQIRLESGATLPLG